ncbi:MAG: (4Fe-4S)-binding protein [Lachnospiraceae bacterium]|nr:(4Fe-4S)-binding protein [Lachnospiraceae bacterium]
MHRLYENEYIVIFWNSAKCYHAKKCVTGSPATFNPNNKPWINMNRAENAEIWQTVEKCPSGALTCVARHNIDVVFEPENCRSVALDGDKKIGECDFADTEDGWNIYHTDVSPEYGGKSIAKRLVYKVLEAAEKQRIAIDATCSYAVKVMNE